MLSEPELVIAESKLVPHGAVSTLTEQIYTARREYKYSALCLAHSQKKLTSYLLKETMDTSTHRIHLQPPI